MGESPDRVFTVGAVGPDRIKDMRFLGREELSRELDITFGRTNILCTFHPVTLSEGHSSQEMTSLTEAIGRLLHSRLDTRVFVTLPNSDTFSDYIRGQWETLLEKYPNNIRCFTNMGDLKYLSLMKECDLVLGNSSSGILEAPFLGKAVVNVGRRQAGRLCSAHVISCGDSADDIEQAVNKALVPQFQKELINVQSIYGDGNACEAIYERIKTCDLKGLLFKVFHDQGERP